MAGNHARHDCPSPVLRYAVDIAKSVFKAGLLYMAGKLFKKLLPCSTVLLWVAFALRPDVSLWLFVAVFVAIPYISALIVRLVYGNEVTYS